MKRQILHCDMNNFFASAELISHPEFVSKPVAVCGDIKERHGIVLAKNEIAKRLGVSTGDPIFKALEKAKDLVILKPHYEKYLEISRNVRKILCEYTDLVEPFGIDECWMDVSGSERLFGNGEIIASNIKDRIKHELGLTCSVGVSFNKSFAKLGSDLKKPDAVSVISEENFKEKIWGLPAGALLGVGSKTAYDLSLFGIKTIGNLANSDIKFLNSRYGKSAEYLYSSANGLDFSPVMPCDYTFPIKSIGHGVTTTKDLTDYGEVWRVILELVQNIGEKLRFHKLRAKGISVGIRDKYLLRKEFQCRLLCPSNSNMPLAKSAFELFSKRCDLSVPIRSITIRAIDLEDVFSSAQISMFEETNFTAYEKIDRTVDEIRKKFGKNALTNASLITFSPFRELNKTEETVFPNKFR